MDIETIAGTATAVALVALMAGCGASQARESISTNPTVAGFRDDLQSGGQGPRMVPIPAGTFTMGCLSADSDCRDDEKPTREVTLGAFALGVTEVTFDEWYLCVAKGGCPHIVFDRSRHPGNWPMESPSQHHAEVYVAWLSRETGEEYRLPTESEWEYAARAGTTTKYWWGDDIGANRLHGDWCGHWCDHPENCPQEFCSAVGPVGSFDANPWGLHDMHGNQTEWVADCWHDNYEGAPTDGSAWLAGCRGRGVVRGGPCTDPEDSLRAAKRCRARGDWPFYGFRVARTLAP